MTERPLLPILHGALPAALLLAGLCWGCGSGGEQGDAGEYPTQVPPPPASLEPPVGPGAMAPDLLAVDGDLLLSWTEPDPSEEGHHRILVSRSDGLSWSEPAVVISSADLFVNWADFPVLAAAGDGSLYIHWLQKSGPGTYAYDVMLARSTDGGASWEPLGKLHDDATETEHGFVSWVPEGDGVRAFWLDGREMAGGGGHGHGEGSMTLRTARVGEAPGAGELLDPMTCECCQTGAAVTASGPIVVYRGRTPEEIRDIMIIRRDGDGWTRPAPVHRDGWEVPGCPVNGPAVAAAGDQVVVAWFTAAGDRPRVLASFSADGGTSFGDPVEVDGTDPLGRVDVTLLEDGDAAVVWLDTEGDEAVLRFRRVRASGELGEPEALANTSSSRGSGFPRMARVGEILALAWTETGEPSRVRLARMGLSATAAGSASPAAPPELETGRPWDRSPGSSAPDYEVESLDGEAWNLARDDGEPYLLNLWATWCGPCRKEIPDLVALDAEMAPRGLRVVGLSVDDTADLEAVREMVAGEGMDYPVYLDVEGGATSLFGVAALPASFLFDRHGILVWRSFGLVRPDDPELREALERALEP